MPGVSSILTPLNLSIKKFLMAAFSESAFRKPTVPYSRLIGNLIFETIELASNPSLGSVPKNTLPVGISHFLSNIKLSFS